MKRGILFAAVFALALAGASGASAATVVVPGNSTVRVLPSISPVAARWGSRTYWHGNHSRYWHRYHGCRHFRHFHCR